MPTKNDVEDVKYNYTVDSIEEGEELRVLRNAISELKKELERYNTPPLMIAEVRDIINKKAIIKIQNGNQFMVNISVGCEKIDPGDQVLVEQKHLTIIKKVGISKDFDVERFVIVEKPKESWKVIGGLKTQINEVKEVIELPLKKPKLFKKIGIQPPKGLLLYGPPGTGKTLLAKAVAASTNSTFIEIVGSELVQKFIGEGAKYPASVHTAFISAPENFPIFFIIFLMSIFLSSTILFV